MPAVVFEVLAGYDGHKESRRAQAVLETRRLKELFNKGLIPKERYLDHIKDLARFVVENENKLVDPLPKATRNASGIRRKTTKLDEMLIDYLLGTEMVAAEENSRKILGTW
jgi:hypothetical protein